MRTHVDGGSRRPDHLAPVLLTEREELWITRCMLLGCRFVHDDFGHSERANARNHYQCINNEFGWWGWGKSEGEAARDYLRRYQPELL